MESLSLRELHGALNARFGELNGAEVVAHYGDAIAEYAALRGAAGVLDLSFRGRICLTGADRVRFLHGQVTNDVKGLKVGEGCYAALVTAKGKMECDLNIYVLESELLLDFEPGLTAAVAARLEKYIVADDVQVVDVAAHYGLLSVQGPKAASVVRATELFSDVPEVLFASVRSSDPVLGEVYLMNRARVGLGGYDLFVPLAGLGAVADRLIAAARGIGGRACGWDAFELARIEAGIPRYGLDMDETNIPLECGIEALAVNYKKGCYIGQEVINRVHTIGHVTKELRGLLLGEEVKALPTKGTRLFSGEKEVGYITSAARLPSTDKSVALGYVRREANAIGTELRLGSAGGESVKVVRMPFERLDSH